MTTHALLDDTLLLRYLCGRDRWLHLGHRPATAAAWWLRAARAVEAGRGGTLTSVVAGMSPEGQALVRRYIRRLPDDIVVPHPRDVVATAASLSVHYRLNVLAADVLATAIALDAVVLVATGNDGPRLREVAEQLGLRYEVVQP